MFLTRTITHCRSLHLRCGSSCRPSQQPTCGWTLPTTTLELLPVVPPSPSPHYHPSGTNHKSCIRYQATTTTNTSSSSSSSTGSDGTTKKADPINQKSNNIDHQIERLLENVEEIVDVPTSVMNEVVDKSKYTHPIPIPMPDLGTSHGNSPDRYSLVKEWFFQTGDIIQHEDVLCDIETPDFTFGMETDDEGVTIMGDILVPAGQPVPDGTILCYTLHPSNGNPPEPDTRPQKDDDDDDDDDNNKDDPANVK